MLRYLVLIDADDIVGLIPLPAEACRVVAFEIRRADFAAFRENPFENLATVLVGIVLVAGLGRVHALADEQLATLEAFVLAIISAACRRHSWAGVKRHH